MGHGPTENLLNFDSDHCLNTHKNSLDFHSYLIYIFFFLLHALAEICDTDSRVFINLRQKQQYFLRFA